MRSLSLFIAIVAFSIGARANIVPAPLFTDHAVLQREKPIPVWGRADPGERVTATFHGQTIVATAASDGRWIVYLDALPALSEPADLVITGTSNAIRLHDIVVGEVWLCSGQSNMELPVSRAKDAPQEIAKSTNEKIRCITIRHEGSETPKNTVGVEGGWKTASPQTTGDFTAVGYYFARDLQPRLNIPIGIIHSSWGGTPVESWMSAHTLASTPSFAVVNERWKKRLADEAAKSAEYDKEMARRAALEAEAAKAGKPKPEFHWLSMPARPGHPNTPSGLFNNMINPLIPYALRGVLWYQGESNVGYASEYRALFSAMIAQWRSNFGQGNIPFFWVQLANFKNYNPSGADWAFLREAQTQTLSLPATGQALTIDIGDPDDIHPKNKQEVGRRLSLIARAQVYGATVDFSGPAFSNAKREGAGMRVRFASGAEGLTSHDKPPQSLELAGVDKIFHPASARIEGDTLFVFSKEVPEPVAVRYAWRNSPDANLYNSAGLPAISFRSDNWVQ